MTPMSLPGHQPNIKVLQHLYLKSKINNKRQNELIPYNGELIISLYLPPSNHKSMQLWAVCKIRIKSTKKDISVLTESVFQTVCTATSTSTNTLPFWTLMKWLCPWGTRPTGQSWWEMWRRPASEQRTPLGPPTTSAIFTSWTSFLGSTWNREAGT